MQKDFAFEVKSTDGAGEFTGRASVYNVLDSQNDIVVSGAFAKTIREHGKSVPLLWQHQAASPIGTVDLEDTPTGLNVRGKLLLSIQQAAEAYELLKAGIVKGLSIGFQALVADFRDDGVRLLKELRLFEISAVTFPALELALITSVKSDDEERQISRALDELMLTLKHANRQHETRQRPPRMRLF
jgi:uncharacterized protein